MNTTPTIDTFTQGFLECLLWSESQTDDEGNDLGQFSDDYDVASITAEGLASIIEDCKAFQADNKADLSLYQEERDLAHAGHDFCLTRNGHGAGFWDRGMGELGQRLTKAAKAYGTIGLYVIDDESIGVHN